MPTPPTDATRMRQVRVIPTEGEPRLLDRAVAEEVAVNLVYGTVPFAVMMATPADLEDFAVGFSLTEGIIAAAADIRGAVAHTAEGGLRLDVDLAPSALHAHLARRRSMSGRTACGVCGVEDLAAVPRTTPRARPNRKVAAAAIRQALAALDAHQALNRATGAVHAAAFAGLDGVIRLVREDVGRHNALDKLIGAALRAGQDPADGFVVVTSRASFEMIEKTAAFGAHTLVAISMPTGLAIDRAALHDIALVGVARRDSMTVFHGHDRIVTERVLA